MHQPESVVIPQNNRHVIIGYLFVLLGAFGFSAKAILVKLAYSYSHQLDAITLLVLRMAIALPFFLVVSLWMANDSTTNNGQRLNKQDWLMILGLGLLGYYMSSLLDFWGLQYIPVGLERLIIFLYPTFVVVFSAIMQRKAINRHQMIALTLSYAGMILVFAENMSAMTSSGLWVGSSLVFCSAIAFAFFLIGSGMVVKRIGSMRFTAYSMTVACLATGVHFIVQHGAKFLNLPTTVYWLALILAIFSTVLPAFLINAGIGRIGAGSASIISSTGPIGTLTLAFFVLGETLTLAQLAGTALVLIGVYVVSRAKA